MKPLKIVILAGVIYPHNSPRAFRSTELAIGLANKGHDVTLYGLTGKYDYSKFQQDSGVRVKGMGKSYFGNLNSDNEFLTDSKIFWACKGLLKKLLYNIIDYPRIEYYFKSIKILKKEKKFDYLITVAHPFGVHWGAAHFKKKTKNCLFNVWTADCGDPFMGDPDVNRKKIFLEPIERFWCEQADFITIPVEAAKSGYYKEYRDKLEVIPQGIDFTKIEISKYERNKIPTFLYSGVVYPGMRDPSAFLDYLCAMTEDFKFIVYAPSDNIFGNYKERLKDKLEIRRYIPRLELIKIISTMDFIINLRNNSEVQQPSKLIDYGLSKRPIVEISSSFSKNEKDVFEQFLKGNFSNQKHIQNLSQFDISNVCDKFIELYERKISQ